ncbi:hypothetical protein K502DRAFT_327903 [Neoconidiobolus thromboides FSU 785]|nr:hypothetical protein K502DRAFT_327903 [Neoconidiobolus thromboides FSU 785]
MKFASVCSKDYAIELLNTVIAHHIVEVGPECINGEGIAKVLSKDLDTDYKYQNAFLREIKECLMKNKDVKETSIEVALDCYDFVGQNRIHLIPKRGLEKGIR